MAKENQSITVMELYSDCVKLIKNGMGNRHILMSGDDEGNSFHEMFFGFSPDMKGESIEYGFPFGMTKEKFDKEYVLLG